MERKEWRKQIIELYESGKLAEAESLFLTRLRFEGKYRDIHQAVKRLKVESESGYIGLVGVIVLTVILYLIFKS